jgi:hypothetical protein
MQCFYSTFPWLKACSKRIALLPLVIQGPSQLPGEHTAELQIRGQRYRLHSRKCHHYQLGTPLTHV